MSRPTKEPRISQEDRDHVRDFVRHVVEWSGQTWDELSYRSGVPSTTLHGWRYGRATPEAPGLVAFLQAAGVLNENYEINFAKPAAVQRSQAELEAAQHEAAEASRIAHGLRPQDDQESAS